MTRNKVWTMTSVLAAGLAITFADDTHGAVSWDEPVRKEHATAVVSGGLDDLKAKLAAARPGDVIWVATEAISVDPAVEEPQEIQIPPGVTLAGGRAGMAPGPVLSTSRLHNDPEAPRRSVFRLGDGARVTGLRFRGPSGTTAKQHDVVGITIEGPITRVQVDRCEFFNWTRAGIFMENAGSPENPGVVRITRNYFHHNQAAGNGYGINVRVGSYPLIDRSTFDYNRHVISCDGRPFSGYRAVDNFVLSGGHDYRYEWNGIPFRVWDQHFDMHGQPSDGGAGGHSVYITHNTIRGEQKYGLPFPPFQKTRAAFKLRGTPSEDAFFEHNALAHDSRDEAIHDNQSDKKVKTAGNKFSVSTSDEIAVGEFDGDGTPDVFQATGAGWYYSSGGVTEWRFLNRSDNRLPEMRLGDFDGNGKTDLFAVHGTDWVVSYDGTGKWQTINTNQPYGVSELVVGEFDGDRRADLFRADGERWWVWKSSTRSWEAINTSGKGLGELQLADLNCDGITDVLSDFDDRWRISDSGTGRWRVLNERLFRLDYLRFGDFDGNGCTDIAWTHVIQAPPLPGVPPPPPEYNWYWSPSGTGSQQLLHASAEGWLRQNRIGDFNNDGRADVLRYRNPPHPAIFEFSPGGSSAWIARSIYPMQ